MQKVYAIIKTLFKTPVLHTKNVSLYFQKIKTINILVDNLENFWNIVSYEKCRKGHSLIPHSFLDTEPPTYMEDGITRV